MQLAKSFSTFYGIERFITTFTTAAMGLSSPNQLYLPTLSNPVPSWLILIMSRKSRRDFRKTQFLSISPKRTKGNKTLKWRFTKKQSTKFSRGPLSCTTNVWQINGFRSHAVRSLFWVHPSWPPAHYTRSIHFWYNSTTERHGTSNVVISSRLVIGSHLPLHCPPSASREHYCCNTPVYCLTYSRLSFLQVQKSKASWQRITTNACQRFWPRQKNTVLRLGSAVNRAAYEFSTQGRVMFQLAQTFGVRFIAAFRFLLHVKWLGKHNLFRSQNTLMDTIYSHVQ